MFGDANFGLLLFGMHRTYVDIANVWNEECKTGDGFAQITPAVSGFTVQTKQSNDWDREPPSVIPIRRCG